MRLLILILLYVLKRALDVDHDFFIYSLLKPCLLFHLTIKSIDLRAIYKVEMLLICLINWALFAKSKETFAICFPWSI